MTHQKTSLSPFPANNTKVKTSSGDAEKDISAWLNQKYPGDNKVGGAFGGGSSGGGGAGGGW